MTSNAYPIAKKTVRLAVCAAMLALPLGPFSLSDALSAAFAGSASGTQTIAEQDEQQGWVYEYPLNSRVALNQPLGVSAKLAVAQPENSSSATQGNASYSAILQYETYGIADEYNTLASTDAVVEATTTSCALTTRSSLQQMRQTAAGPNLSKPGSGSSSPTPQTARAQRRISIST